LATFLVVRDGNQLIGVVGIEMFIGFGLLRSLAVSPIYQGQEVASQMIKQGEELSKAL
jgi:N-acetylglutamate synthase-like GNAT family acetyltransferase